MFIIKEEFYGEVKGMRDVRVFECENYMIKHRLTDQGKIVRDIIINPNTEKASRFEIDYKIYVMNEKGATVDKIYYSCNGEESGGDSSENHKWLDVELL